MLAAKTVRAAANAWVKTPPAMTVRYIPYFLLASPCLSAPVLYLASPNDCTFPAAFMMHHNTTLSACMLSTYWQLCEWSVAGRCLCTSTTHTVRTRSPSAPFVPAPPRWTHPTWGDACMPMCMQHSCSVSCARAGSLTDTLRGGDM